jgi:(1->4)-alpha-D-glucan 1-alpha-D-glucosylmutase
MRSRAEELRPELAETFDVLQGLLLDSRSSSAAARDLVIRFQQVCGPVMAKGVEDTTFYRYNRMIALNEVGGDPAALDHPSMDALHAWAERQSLRHPTGMTALSTHDTKRGEDVRARLLAAAEDVEGWQRVWDAVRAAARETGVDEPTAYLMAQTLIGSWSLDSDRLHGYLEKAVREAKRHTTWVDPDPDYERRVHDLGDRCLTDGSLAADLESFTTALEPHVRAVTLTTKLVQLMLPGVPDVYQGCETVERFLVDPDNRRPVDYASRQDRLRRLDSSAGCDDLNDEKLWITTTALRVRRELPELVGASATYRELPTTSPHVIGFLRSEKLAVLGTRWPGGQARVGWTGSTVSLPDGAWSDRLSGRAVGGGAEVDCATLFADFPVSLLIREAE